MSGQKASFVTVQRPQQPRCNSFLAETNRNFKGFGVLSSSRVERHQRLMAFMISIESSVRIAAVPCIASRM